MNKRLIELAQQATGVFTDLPGECPSTMDKAEFEKFAELIVADTVDYLNSEINRLYQYQNRLLDSDVDKKVDVDLAIEKCEDNIQGIKKHFGVT